jgi:nicotinate-nucleotide adenylyltransferase
MAELNGRNQRGDGLSSQSKVGIFGGTFDPPHIGHLILAAEAYVQLGLDRILWVLTPNPPHKQDKKFAPVAARQAMVLAAIANNPAYVLSSVDLDRIGPHYACDTVQIIASQHPGTAISYIVGEDSLLDFPRWHRPQDLVSACDEIGVMRRSGHASTNHQLEESIPGIGAKISYINTPLIQISSSLIRERIATGGHFRYYLPDGVYREIILRNLYSD